MLGPDTFITACRTRLDIATLDASYWNSQSPACSRLVSIVKKWLLSLDSNQEPSG